MADGKGYDHVSASLEYPRGGRYDKYWDTEGQSRGYEKNSLQTVPCHSAGILALSWWKRKGFQQSDFAGHEDEGLHLHSVGL